MEPILNNNITKSLCDIQIREDEKTRSSTKTYRHTARNNLSKNLNAQ